MTQFLVMLAVVAWAPGASAQSYSVTDAMRDAVARSPARSAAASMSEASNAGRRVEAAGLWPQLVATGSARYNQPIAELNFPILPEPIELGTAWNASTGLTAQWRVLDLSRWSSVDAAALREQASQATEQDAVLEVERAVRDLYLGAAYMDDVIAAAELSQQALTQSLEDLKAQLEVGLAAEVDVAAAQARVAEVEARLIDAKTHRESALAALRVMLGLGESAPITLSQKVTEIAMMESPGAAGESPSVTSTRLNAEAAEHDATASVRRWWPTIDLFATGEYRYPKTLVEKTAGFGWIAGAQITWLLFDGGLRFAATDAQRAKASAMRSSAQGLQEQLAIQQADAAGRIASADASIDAAQSRLDATLALKKLTRVALDAGTARVTDMLDAEVQVDQARLAQVTAMYQLALAKSALWRATAAEFSTRESKP